MNAAGIEILTGVSESSEGVSVVAMRRVGDSEDAIGVRRVSERDQPNFVNIMIRK